MMRVGMAATDVDADSTPLPNTPLRRHLTKRTMDPAAQSARHHSHAHDIHNRTAINAADPVSGMFEAEVCIQAVCDAAVQEDLTANSTEMAFLL